MRRRTFCGAALAGAALGVFPLDRLLATEDNAVGRPTGDLPALSGTGKQITLQPSDIEELRGSLRGQLLLPGQDGYDGARKVWNGAFDRKPALIARCAGAADVAQAVTFAREHDLLVAVRGGGHSLSGQSVCDGGLMIDLSRLKGVRIDPVAMTARVEPGVLLGEFDREAQSFGLATPAGTVSHTGIAGLTLGGGFGRIARKYGLSCDNVRSVDLIAASGKLVQAGEKENGDLLWGLRGGGGNFGVVTSFEYRLHAVPTMMLGGLLVYPFEQARDVLDFFSGFAADASDDLYLDATLAFAPDGRKALLLEACYCGRFEDGERELKALREFRKPLQDTVQPTSYVQLQRSGDEIFPVGRRYYLKAGFLRRLDPALLDEAVERFRTAPAGAAIAIVHHGGAISRVRPDASAFWHREAQHSILLIARWDDPALTRSNSDWVRSTWPAFETFTRGFYVNDLAHDDTAERVRANYGGNYERLLTLKRRYDPANLFRMNANVVPNA